VSAPTVAALVAARIHAAEAVLAERGLAGTRVEALGDAGEIAVLSVGEENLATEKVADLVASLRALGFRHITLDLA
jgi:PP-loop superfamily ATP-utilizing enzyme